MGVKRKGRGASPDDMVDKMFDAIIHGGEKRLASLLASGVSAESVSNHGLSGLMQAAVMPGRAGCIRILLGAGADPDRVREGRTALMLAAGNGNLDAVEELLAGGAGVGQVDEKGWTALHWAASVGKMGSLSALAAVCDHDVVGLDGRRARDVGPPEVAAFLDGMAMAAGEKAGLEEAVGDGGVGKARRARI